LPLNADHRSLSSCFSTDFLALPLNIYAAQAKIKGLPIGAIFNQFPVAAVLGRGRCRTVQFAHNGHGADTIEWLCCARTFMILPVQQPPRRDERKTSA
jgi:hypothetical protein